MKVGRSFQRFALQATALGIRHAPINEPVEVPAVRVGFASWPGLGDARPGLIVQFGYAPDAYVDAPPGRGRAHVTAARSR